MEVNQIIPFPNKKYQIIYADPAWRFNKGVYQEWRPSHQGKDRVLDDVYQTMSIEELKRLPVNKITDNDCVLFMWFTYSHLPKALLLCESWGFKYKTIAFVWLKLSNKGNVLSNIGAWTMGNTESCLIATKGNMLKYKKCNNVKQLISPNTELRLKGKHLHSKKPSETRDRIVKLFGDLPRIELFARPPKDLLFEDESYKGWDLWGNEC